MDLFSDIDVSSTSENNNQKDSDLRIVKFEVLINDIEKALNGEDNKTSLLGIVKSRTLMLPKSLDLVYDYEKLNNYGKIIYDNVKKDNDSEYENLNDIKSKINKAKKLVSYCKEEENKIEGYKFIFWTLLILTVDKTDYQKHLSLICDFARMLKITDDEIRDILYIIKTIYHKKDVTYFFKTETIPKYFFKLLDLYELIDMEW